MKLNEVKCPAKSEGIQCASYEVTFGLPIYKDREYDEVIIEGVCDSCGHQFQVHGHIIVDKMK